MRRYIFTLFSLFPVNFKSVDVDAKFLKRIFFPSEIRLELPIILDEASYEKLNRSEDHRLHFVHLKGPEAFSIYPLDELNQNNKGSVGRSGIFSHNYNSVPRNGVTQGLKDRIEWFITCFKDKYKKEPPFEPLTWLNKEIKLAGFFFLFDRFGKSLWIIEKEERELINYDFVNRLDMLLEKLKHKPIDRKIPEEFIRSLL